MSRGGDDGNEPGTRWLEDSREPVASTLRRALDDAAAGSIDELTRRRLWTRVAQPRMLPLEAPAPSARRWWLLAGTGAAVGAAASALVLLLVSREPEALVPTNAPVVAQAEGAAAPPNSPASARDATRPPVDAPGTWRTGEGERLRLILRGGAEAELAPHSLLTVDADLHPELRAGSVRMQVPKQPPGQQFAVSAGPYRVLVVGTRFGIEVHDRAVAVEVEEGVVEVHDGARLLRRLTAGQGWSAPAVRAEAGQGRPPALAPVRAVARAHAPPRALPAKASSAASLPGAPASAPRSILDDLAMRPASPMVLPGTHVAAQTEPQAASPVGVAPAAPVPAAPPVDPLREARRALAAGDPDRAVAILDREARREGPAGENAAYELGKALRDHLLRPREALEVWRKHRAHHPSGLLRAEIDISVLETLVKLGDTGAALREADAFLARHPRSERRREVEALRARLSSPSGR